MNLENLRADVARLKAEVNALREAENLTDEQVAQLEKLTADLKTATARVRAAEAAESAVTDADTASPRTVPAPQPSEVRAYETDRDREIAARGGYASVAEFARDVASVAIPGRAPSNKFDKYREIMGAPSNWHNEGTGADGGFAVPPQYSSEIWSAVFDGFDIVGLMNLQPTGSNSVNITKDEATPWTTSGVRAAWEGEGDAVTSTKTALSQANVRLNKLVALVSASDELLEDAPLLRSHLTTKAGEAIRYKASDAIINGDGVGKPLGILNGGSLVTQAKVTSQTADTINATNVVSMDSRLLGTGMGAFWMVNPDAYPQLPLMTIGNYPVFSPPTSGLKDAPFGTLLGKPVVKSHLCQTLGDKGDIYLIDPAGYAGFVKQGGVQAAESMHLWFDYGLMAFRWTFRIGGQPYLSAAVTPPNSSVTQSHCVTLAART